MTVLINRIDLDEKLDFVFPYAVNFSFSSDVIEIKGEFLKGQT
jgi:hypothetical protein